MLFAISDVIPKDKTEILRNEILALDYVDGKQTAGWNARIVKNNLQASKDNDAYREINKKIMEIILKNETFGISTRYKKITPLLFSRYSNNMSYGSHVDSCMISGLRADISFTLALSDPDSYEGGELVIQEAGGERSFKLDQGEMIIYPSTTIHRVEPVTHGERLAAVGWIQSCVRDAHKREILYDLDVAMRNIFLRDGKTNEFDLLLKTQENLSRLWFEV